MTPSKSKLNSIKCHAAFNQVVNNAVYSTLTNAQLRVGVYNPIYFLAFFSGKFCSLCLIVNRTKWQAKQ